MSFPAEVRAEMGRQRISNQALSERSGLHEAQVARKIAREERDLSLSEAEAVGRAVGVPAWELMRRASESPEAGAA